MATEQENFIRRPPVIVIVGHIDHGKSTLLDYIRQSNITAGEAGGITQHLSAYEVSHETKEGEKRRITFLDTPGHEAFAKMRGRGLEIADIAVLAVSAEDGVKAQTLESLALIKERGLLFIVAITKIDKPTAHVERTKQSLLEHEIFLEGFGGDVPWVALSAKTGEGVSELLDLLLLVADLADLRGNPTRPAEGVVIESNRDSRRGISATLIIKDGTLKTGMFVAAGDSISPVRSMENFLGEQVKELSFSSPVRIGGFNTLPKAGTPFVSCKTKKEAEKIAHASTEVRQNDVGAENPEGIGKTVVPVVIKTDVAGTHDAILHELEKVKHEDVEVKILSLGVGPIGENDIKIAGGKPGALIIGFNVKVDGPARELAERTGAEIAIFDIIYKLTEWVAKALAARAPRKEQMTGRATILKVFSSTKTKQVLGGKVTEGSLAVKGKIRIMREAEEIGRGTILNLQRQKTDTKEVSAGNEFGAQINFSPPVQSGDVIEAVAMPAK